MDLKRAHSPASTARPRRVLNSAVALERMSLTELCDRFEARQHRVLRGELARLDARIRTVTARAGARHPELRQLRSAFVVFRRDFTAHLREEARSVFPLIRRLEIQEGSSRTRRSLRARAARVIQQHGQADEAIAELRELAGDHDAAAPRPRGRRDLRDALARFQRNLHEQVYAENQILFPRALAIRQA